ncbi:LANO_0G11804g1_1 [Lachancea nothofagi CBS 11611]|uniref:LANO_0G11804g1_1 n=1 Tax=Lachancea nothofagi CBS 11611 TaxID=1266666 RepID=A0A1G4KK03_9SACH|nr:LANO_0G11804g1_1 [Lachancea nothofagi CBS 11611]
MSKTTREVQLEKDLNKIVKAHTDTVVAEAQREIEASHAYINEKQLKKLIELHDNILQEKCSVPMQKLYHKYSQNSLQEGDLQNWAELVDRDVRILEATMKRVRDNQRDE